MFGLVRTKEQTTFWFVFLFFSDLNDSYLDFGRGPNTPGSLSSSGRSKRMRTSFKHHQLRTMKSYFSINHNPDAKDLKQLSQKTSLPKRVLQVRDFRFFTLSLSLSKVGNTELYMYYYLNSWVIFLFLNENFQFVHGSRRRYIFIYLKKKTHYYWHVCFYIFIYISNTTTVTKILPIGNELSLFEFSHRLRKKFFFFSISYLNL